jgi:quercetin dioxygenase-like cupin family protein
MVLAKDVEYVYSLGNVNVFNYFVNKGYGLPGHEHKSEHTLDVTQGEMLVTVGDNEYILNRKSEAMILPANIFHEAVATVDNTIFNSLFLKDVEY